jgi:hypothetical protein
MGRLREHSVGRKERFVSRVSPAAERRAFRWRSATCPKDREARAATPGSGLSGADVPKLGLTLAPAGQVAGSGVAALQQTGLLRRTMSARSKPL